jgi:hypothetical protein
MSLIGGVVVFLLVAGTTGALAHRVYQGWTAMWENDGRCVKLKATVDHGSYGKGFFGAEVSTVKRSLDLINCRDTWTRPRDNLRVKYIVYRGFNLNICLNPGYYQNQVDTAYIAMKLNQPNSPPCGSGNYAVKARGSTLFNGSWTTDNNGLITNQWHYLPDYASSPPF